MIEKNEKSMPLGMFHGKPWIDQRRPSVNGCSGMDTLFLDEPNHDAAGSSSIHKLDSVPKYAAT